MFEVLATCKGQELSEKRWMCVGRINHAVLQRGGNLTPMKKEDQIKRTNPKHLKVFSIYVVYTVLMRKVYYTKEKARVILVPETSVTRVGPVFRNLIRCKGG